MHTEHLFARWMEPNSSSWANPAVKTVPFALSGCVPNPCSAAQNAFAAVKHLAPHPPTANACTPRDTPHWDNLYRHRVVVERTINLMKDTFVLDSRKSFRSVSAKADTYLCAITQLVGVLLADSIHKLSLFKSLRKLIA